MSASAPIPPCAQGLPAVWRHPRPRIETTPATPVRVGTTGAGVLQRNRPSVNTSHSILLAVFHRATALLLDPPEATGLYTNVLGAASPHTNSLNGPRQFFRLIGN